MESCSTTSRRDLPGREPRDPRDYPGGRRDRRRHTGEAASRQPRRGTATWASPATMWKACGGCCSTTPDDFVLATGEAHSVAEFCEVAFGHVGLDYRDHVVVDERFMQLTRRGRLPARRPDQGPGTRVGAVHQLQRSRHDDGRRRAGRRRGWIRRRHVRVYTALSNSDLAAGRSRIQRSDCAAVIACV